MDLKVCPWLFCCLWISVPGSLAALTTVYLTENCGVTMTTLLTGRLESSRSLISKHNTDCTFTVKVPSGRTILLDFLRFHLEVKVGDICVDYLNVHDGESLSSPRLNVAPLCDEQMPWKYVTTGPAITFHYVTDSSAASNGFDIIFSSRQKGPCTDDQFSCNNSYCVPQVQKCDEYSQCGDDSDESSCIAEKAKEEKTIGLGLIIGLVTAGVVLVTLLVCVGVIIHRQLKLKQFLEAHEIGPMPWEIEAAKRKKATVHYPITKEYSKYNQGRHVRIGRSNAVNPSFSDTLGSSSETGYTETTTEGGSNINS